MISMIDDFEVRAAYYERWEQLYICQTQFATIQSKSSENQTIHEFIYYCQIKGNINFEMFSLKTTGIERLKVKSLCTAMMLNLFYNMYN